MALLPTMETFKLFSLAASLIYIATLVAFLAAIRRIYLSVGDAVLLFQIFLPSLNHRPTTVLE